MTVAERVRGWLGLGEPAGVAGHEVLPWDGVPWEFAAPAEGVVAIGDLQGDLLALDALTRACGLTDRHGEWCGGQRHLVLAGDLVGGHADARLLVAFVMRLQQQARRAGGCVHALLGNHDVMPAWGEVGKWTHRERRAWREFPPAGASEVRARTAFAGDSEVAVWLRSRNAIVRIGDSLFAHAGVGPWLEHVDPGAVNATIRAWLAHWQGKAAAPPRATRWCAGAPGMARESRLARGPLWTRAFKPDGRRRRRGAPARDDLARWLAARGAVRLVVGHAPVEAGEIALEHPYYGELVVRLDTRIVDARHGGLSALVQAGGRLRALSLPATSRDAGCRQRESRRLATPSVAARSWWRRLRDWLAGFWN